MDIRNDVAELHDVVGYDCLEMANEVDSLHVERNDLVG